MVDDHVPRDREQPHPQAGQVRVEPIRRAPGPQEDFLHDVLRRTIVPGRPEREAVKLTTVCVVGEPYVGLGGHRGLGCT